MSACKLTQMRLRLRLTKVGLASVLGYTPLHIGRMESGLPIPRHVLWAMVGVAARLQPDAVAEFITLAEGE